MKNKTSQSVITAFSKILKRSGYFSSLQTDLGTEFTNKAFQSWLKDHNIHFFHTYNREIKASIEERFFRTIKEKLFRYLTYSNVEIRQRNSKISARLQPLLPPLNSMLASRGQPF